MLKSTWLTCCKSWSSDSVPCGQRRTPLTNSVEQLLKHWRRDWWTARITNAWSHCLILDLLWLWSAGQCTQRAGKHWLGQWAGRSHFGHRWQRCPDRVKGRTWVLDSCWESGECAGHCSEDVMEAVGTMQFRHSCWQCWTCTFGPGARARGEDVEKKTDVWVDWWF